MWGKAYSQNVYSKKTGQSRRGYFSRGKKQKEGIEVPPHSPEGRKDTGTVGGVTRTAQEPAPDLITSGHGASTSDATGTSNAFMAIRVQEGRDFEFPEGFNQPRPRKPRETARKQAT